MAFKMKGPSLYKNSPMKDESKMTAAQKEAALLAAAEKTEGITVDGNKKKNNRKSNIDLAVDNMRYKKESANETFNEADYRKTLTRDQQSN